MQFLEWSPMRMWSASIEMRQPRPQSFSKMLLGQGDDPSRHSRRSVPISLSQSEFAFGLPTGVSMTSRPMRANESLCAHFLIAATRAVRSASLVEQRRFELPVRFGSDGPRQRSSLTDLSVAIGDDTFNKAILCEGIGRVYSRKRPNFTRL